MFLLSTTDMIIPTRETKYKSRRFTYYEEKGLSVMLCAAMAASCWQSAAAEISLQRQQQLPAAETTAAAADTTAAPEKSEAETEAEARMTLHPVI